MALRISVAAFSLISSDACSLYQAVWGVQIRLGASFRAPWEKLQQTTKERNEKQSDEMHKDVNGHNFLLPDYSTVITY